jgi:hypothetical protein
MLNHKKKNEIEQCTLLVYSLILLKYAVNMSKNCNRSGSHCCITSAVHKLLMADLTPYGMAFSPQSSCKSCFDPMSDSRVTASLMVQILSQTVGTVHTCIFTFYSSLERERHKSDMVQKGVLM